MQLNEIKYGDIYDKSQIHITQKKITKSHTPS